MVTNSLGRMTVQLDSMINEVYKMEIEKKESELRALQAQMNPHFLYNCLSGKILPHSIKQRTTDHNGEQ